MISQHVRENFNTLQDASRDGNLALLECERDGDKVNIIVAICHCEDGTYQFVPFAQMLEGNPYDYLVPPEV